MEDLNEIFMDSNLKRKFSEVAFDPANKAHKRELNKILQETFYMDFEDCMITKIYEMLSNSHPQLRFKIMIERKK